MSDPLHDYLFSTRRTSGDDLKQAAMLVAGRFLEKRANMNEGIAEVARERSLNSEQVQRVVESANQYVYSSLFKTEESKQIEFPLADGRVVQQLLNMGTEKTASRSTLDTLIDEAKRVSAGKSLDVYLMEKVAEFEPSFERANFQRGWLEARDAAKELAQEARGSTQLAKEAASDLVRRVRMTIDIDGTEPESIQAAITGVARNEAIAKTAMRLCFGDDTGYQPGGQVQRVNPKHPVIEAYTALEEAIATASAKQELAKEAQLAYEQATEYNKQVERVLGIVESVQHVKTAAPLNGNFMQRVGQRLGMLKDMGPVFESVAKKTDNDFSQQALKNLQDRAWDAHLAHYNSLPKVFKRSGGKITPVNVPDEAAFRAGYRPNSAKDIDDEIALLKGMDPKKEVGRDFKATPFGSTAAKVGGAVAVGLPTIAAVHGVAKTMDKGEEAAHGKSAWKRVVQENPDLANNPVAKRQFRTLLSIAPDVARNEMVASRWVGDRSGKFADMGLDPKSLREVADLQRAISDARASSGKVSGSLRSQLLNRLPTQ